ncbi:MAG TPA: hypothetical protein VIJ51_12940 [Solirubrobacteraceae bacterium]
MSSADPAIVAAQSVWSAAASLSPSREMPSPPGIAVDGRGDEIVTWIDDAGRPMARSRASGGGFGRPVVLGPGAALRAAPRVAFDRSGNATVVWLARPGASGAANEVEASYRRRGGRFAAPTRIFGDAGGAELDSPGLGVARDGRVSAFWIAGHVVDVATRAPGKAWSRATPIANPVADDPSLPSYAVAANGDAVAVWSNDDGLYAAIRRGNRRFGAGALLAPAQSGQGGVAIDPHGDAITVWSHCDPAELCQPSSMSIMYATRAPGALSFSAPQTVTPSTGAPSVTMNDRGDATVVWTQPFGDLMAAERPAGGSFGAIETLAPHPVSAPAACYDGRGVVYLARLGATAAGDFAEEASILTPGAGLDGTQILAVAPAPESAFAPSIACSASGGAIAWTIGVTGVSGAQVQEAHVN